jgi:class 3 adenylate cyclase
LSLNADFDLNTWLAALGLSHYAPAFEENHIDYSVLCSLTAEDLREMGLVSIGHRRKALDAIALLNAPTVVLENPALAATVATIPTTQARVSVRALPSVQRRQISVLFCDLVGSTQLSARVDPEDLRDYLHAFRSVVAQAIAEHQGWISQYLGDGVMAYFGYPQAHDHDTEHAVRAALTIVERCTHLPLFHGQFTQVRIGIATGLTVIGKQVSAENGDDDGDAQENAIGETPNLAARAQATAEPNTIVIAPATHQMVGNLFECLDLGAFDLKGFSQPMHLWRVQSERSKGSRFETMREGRQQAALIGRESYLLQIKEHINEARIGTGHILLVKAEGGMGKSRLIGDALGSMGIAANQRLVFQCSSYNAASPLFVVRYFIELQAGIAAGDAPITALRKLKHLLECAGAFKEQEVAVLADLMRIKVANKLPQDLNSQLARAMVFKILLRLLGALAARTGVVVVEDLQWIDPSTSELFSNLANTIAQRPILLIATTRPSALPAWASDVHASTMQLEKLADFQTRRLVQAVAHPQVLSSAVQNAIVARSDGVPIFAEELTRGYIEAASRSQDENSQLSFIPSTLTESLLARLDSFEHGREIAPIASVIGREFPIEVLMRLSGMDNAAVQRGVEELIQAGVFVEGHSRFGKAVAFRHTLLREAAYSLLVRRERVRLHTKVANILETDFSNIAAAAPHFMAFHLSAAGETNRAITQWLRAGQESVARSAYVESIGHFQEALALTQTLPASRERDEQEYAQRIDLISPLIAANGHLAPSVEKEVERVGQLSASLGTQSTAVAPLALQLLLRMTAGKLQEAFELAQRIQHVATAGSDTDRLIAHRYMSTTLLFSGHFALAMAEAERFMALYDPALHGADMDKLGPSSHPLMVMVGLTQANTVFENAEKALFWGQKNLAEARSKGSGHNLSQALIFGHCFPAALSDNYAALDSRSAELSQVVELHDLQTWRGHAALFAGLSLIAQGQSEQGFAQARHGIDQLLEHRSYSNIWFILYAQACQRAGRVQEGLDSLALAAGPISTGLRWLEAEYLRLRGLLGHASGVALPQVISDLKAAQALAQSQGAVLFAKRAQHALQDLGQA